MKKEIPILFNGDMIRAIMSGRKTQTRRVVKPQPEAKQLDRETGYHNIVFRGLEIEDDRVINFAPARPGDWLYVRERLYSDSLGGARYHADAERARINGELPADEGIWDWDSFSETRPGIPSIHMPKSAARIWLEVKSVSVERLQDISEEDAKEEGVQPLEFGYRDYQYNYAQFGAGPQEIPADQSFASLWRRVYGAESWDANPWVWVIQFKTLSTTGKPSAKEGRGV